MELYIVSSRAGTPPPSGYPPLSEANLKSYPLFLRAIQIGACKLQETLQSEGVMFRTILSQLRTSLTLLFLLSGSILYFTTYTFFG